MSALRSQAMQNIYDLSTSQKISLDQAVTTILANSSQSLVAYIVSKGETPVSDPTGMALQAALLRANDIATAANILGTTDEDALQTIEAAEQDAISTGSPDGDQVLPVAVQAALACVLQYASEQSGKSMSQIVKGVTSLGNYYKSGAGQNNDDGIVDVSDPSDITDWLDSGIDSSTDPATVSPVDSAATDFSLSPTSIGSSLAAIPTVGAISVAGGIPTISTSASSLPQVSPDTSGGGVFNAINSVLSGLTSVATSVKTAANSTAGAAGAVKNAISNVGANSIAQYIQSNLGLILLFIIIIIGAIVAVNASKRK